MIYMSGAITGREDAAREQFAQAKEQLVAEGFTESAICNPEEEMRMVYRSHAPISWERCMCECIRRLMLCDAIYMLAGWQDSRGARIEHDLASELGITVIYESGHEPVPESESPHFRRVRVYDIKTTPPQSGQSCWFIDSPSPDAYRDMILGVYVPPDERNPDGAIDRGMLYHMLTLSDITHWSPVEDWDE